MLYHVHCNDWSSKHVFYALNLRIFLNYGWRTRSPAFLKIGCRALAFHIFKNLRLFDKTIAAGLWRYPFYPLWPVNAFFDRSLNVLSVSYTVHIRFFRYVSVTHTAMSVSSPLFVRYLSGTYALPMRFMRSLHLPRRPSSPPRRLSPPDKHFFAFFLFVRRPLALSGDMWQHL